LAGPLKNATILGAYKTFLIGLFKAKPKWLHFGGCSVDLKAGAYLIAEEAKGRTSPHPVRIKRRIK
jgi:hypothetical protein